MNKDKGYTFDVSTCSKFKVRNNNSFTLDIEEGNLHINQEFDLERRFKDVVLDRSGLPIDTRVDDRDIKLFPNFVTFCTSNDGLKQKPYIKQLSTATALLGEYCNDCSDIDWLRNKIKVNDSIDTFIERIELLVEGVCPRCKKTRAEMVLDDGMPFYNELAACIGQRAGKSYLVSLIIAYVTHIFLKIQKPNEVYGVGSNNTFFTTLVALTFGQAKELLYDPFYSLIQNAPWFIEYHKLLDYFSKNEELYNLKDTFTSYKHRNLVIHPAGPDKRILRGRTRNMCSIDEIAYFDIKKDEKVRINATEIHKALSNSLFTVRAAATKLLKKGYNNLPTGLFLNISSPASMRDKIMELYSASQGSAKDYIYGIKASTWEFNPTITRKDLESSFKKDPVEAERDFGANPPLADNAFISSFYRIQDCFAGRKNPVSIQYLRKRMKDSTFTRFAKIVTLTRSLNRPSLMAIDAGYSNNSFALAIGSYGKYGLQIDVFIELQPLPGTPLNYTKIMEEIIVPVIEKRNVKMVVSDRWQNLKLLHDLEDTTDVDIFQYSLKYDDIHYVRQKMYDTEITFPVMEKEFKEVLEYDFDNYPHCFSNDPMSHFMLQCATVRDTGNAVTKNDSVTDDLFRAMCLCVNQMMGEEFSQYTGVMDDEDMGSTSSTTLAKMRSFSSAGGFTRKPGSDGKALGTYKTFR